MELKPYQQKVLNDLSNYLGYLQIHKRIDLAFNQYWEDRVGIYNPLEGTGMEPYKNNVKQVPHVCIKVPTAGGKTYIACNAIKTIFDYFDAEKIKSIVWLVPSVVILEQTIKNLSNLSHPYRQRINAHFNSKVEVYDKNALLQGVGFNPTSVRDQLSIFVLSYDSVRSKKKEDRKFYQENGQLATFAGLLEDKSHLLAGTDETALINVIRQLNPVTILDESHNAETELSVEMLKNFNPSFILDLTATPRKNSNIVSFVDAIALKQENMVKLPVIVYNHRDKTGVIESAINLQKKLELEAKKEEKEGGKYIRPIVLFQAQPKTGEENTTFEKIKKILLDVGIPEKQIKIKTADINEIKNIDLMSKDCEVRFIITVNALKEGWDCPFAYILASLADRSSAVDVEQILGRILRQPYVLKHKAPLLNMSFVLTASGKFMATLQNIVKGLNKAGFSSKDYKVAEDEQKLVPSNGTDVFQQLTLEGQAEEEVDPSKIQVAKEVGANEILKEIESKALEANDALNKVVQDEDSINVTDDILIKVKSYKLKEIFKDEASRLKLPQFFLTVPITSLFGDNGKTLLNKDSLLEGFKLSEADSTINFENISSELYKVDLDKENEYLPAFSQIDGQLKEPLIEYIVSQPKASQVETIAGRMLSKLGKINPITEKEIKAYLRRIFDNLTTEQISDLLTREYTYRDKIKSKINELKESFAERQFSNYLDKDRIVIEPQFQFAKKLVMPKASNGIPKSLYEKEGEMNGFEMKVINDIANLPNILFWHKNGDKKGFCINGFINHYPDFIIQTKLGKTIILETKGDDRDNSDSIKKLKLGKAWANKAGNDYRYFMVFESKRIDGAYRPDEIMPILKEL